MADDFYTNLRDNTVAPLLKQFGFTMQVKSEREPVIDPDTGAITTPATPLLTDVEGIFRFFSQDEITKALQVGQDILANDSQALIEGTALNAIGIVPDTSMQLIARGVTYNIVRVTPTAPGGIDMMYRVQIRR